MALVSQSMFSMLSRHEQVMVGGTWPVVFSVSVKDQTQVNRELRLEL
jgi:hypothetical protein